MRHFTVSLSRVVHLLGVLLGVSFLVFSLLNLLPGDAAMAIVATSGDTSPEAVERIRAQLGLDQPFFHRYFSWLFGVLQGNLGQSYRTGQTVFEMIIERLPVTFELMVLVVFLSLVISIPIAVYAARYRDSLFDRIVAFFSFGLQAIPPFMVVLVMIVVLAVKLALLPAIGFAPISEGLGANLKSMVIPVLALSAPLIPLYIRVLRNEMIRTLQEDFILVARAQGIMPRSILFRYALKPSVPTLITVIGISVGSLVSGSIVVELICGLPGIGIMLYNAINARDYVVVQGVVLLIAAVYVFINFCADLVTSFIDPRVKS